jgi:hypothetical protein
MSERCGRCNRVLRDVISKEKGFGPVCWTKIIGTRERQKGQGRLFKDPELPFCGDIILKRSENGSVLTNVYQQIELHSPNGFEWGYGGSGPAELALNILAMFTDRQTAEELHQIFKWDFVVRVPYDGATIKGKEIRKWIRQHKVA